MNIVITARDRECQGNHCPARGHVEGLPGWTLTIGKRPDGLLDPQAQEQLAGLVGPDEYAVLTPDHLG